MLFNILVMIHHSVEDIHSVQEINIVNDCGLLDSFLINRLCFLGQFRFTLINEKIVQSSIHPAQAVSYYPIIINFIH